MHIPEIIVTDAADDESIQVIGNGLSHFNDQHVGYGDRQPLAVLVRDPQSGDVVGGASGRTDIAGVAISRSVPSARDVARHGRWHRGFAQV